MWIFVRAHLFFLVLTVQFSMTSSALALKAHPYGGEFNKTLNEMFYEDDGVTLSQLKMFFYGEKLEKIRSEIVGPRDGVIKSETNSILISKFRRRGLQGEQLTKKLNNHELTK